MHILQNGTGWGTRMATRFDQLYNIDVLPSLTINIQLQFRPKKKKESKKQHSNLNAFASFRIVVVIFQNILLLLLFSLFAHFAICLFVQTVTFH